MCFFAAFYENTARGGAWHCGKSVTVGRVLSHSFTGTAAARIRHYRGITGGVES